MIIIGITAGLIYPDPERKFFAPKNLSFMVNDMADFLYKEDVLPVLIPPLPLNKMHSLLSKIDGFVFQGGADVCPLSYGETYLDESRWPGDKTRDEYELAVADYAFKHHKPMLGICRGLQLLNVYFGGTLYQDLQIEHSTIVNHNDREIYDHHLHKIDFIPDSLLSKLYHQYPHPYVNSVHHQGIKKLGRDLVVEAVSPQDNLIEAFSHANIGQQFVLGVQWHPEYSHALKGKVIPADLLYKRFIDAIHARKEN